MSRKIAFAGVFAGISVVLLYLSALMPTGRITFYFLASLPVAFTIIEAGKGAGIISYVVICILSGLISGNILGVIPFVFFFGHYPIFKFIIEKRRKATAELLLKLVVFNLSIALWYILFRSLFVESMPSVAVRDSLLTVFLAVAVQVLFLIYDYAFSRLLFFYETRVESFRHR